MQLSVPSVISKVTTLADNTIRVQVDCNEMTPEQTAEIFQHKGRLGYFIFDETHVSAEAISELPEIKLERTEKSPSSRLRAAIYVLWEQTKSNIGSEQFYREQMDDIIRTIKEKLN